MTSYIDRSVYLYKHTLSMRVVCVDVCICLSVCDELEVWSKVGKEIKSKSEENVFRLKMSFFFFIPSVN